LSCKRKKRAYSIQENPHKSASIRLYSDRTGFSLQKSANKADSDLKELLSDIIKDLKKEAYEASSINGKGIE
jgi:carbamoylphosphate synthase large subunit